MKVLVAYATKYGSTRGIADHIGEKLREKGIDADVADVSAIRDINGYTAFVVGSAAYMSHWLKEAASFVSRNRSVLSKHPLWLFSSGPIGTETKNSQGQDMVTASIPKEFEDLKALNPRGTKVFYGALYGDKLKGLTGLGYRMARKIPAARAAMPEGDFRDWKDIEAWASSITQELKGLNEP